ncbi:hypothetical protein E0H26_22720 [Micromonospora zingiberis]|uniref:Uncharacterized protein n=1 Tax=Micromonospora zingiberis TaxID=2053011 RepID=A0A4R0GDY5_9ACTN|nr:hypothetical protein [Micromonospora zingiberis]TCB93361.1 hypothetical protein E0H26_22720 [Micromonospora zingiberis]
MWPKRRTRLENRVVAKAMRSFFSSLSQDELAQPASVARAYAAHLFDEERQRLVAEKRLARSPFHVGIGVSDAEFAGITKRALLVSDTLMLSHEQRHPAHDTGLTTYGSSMLLEPPLLPGIPAPAINKYMARVRMHCPDLESLGQWLVSCRELLCAGLVWYLPRYSILDNPLMAVIHNGWQQRHLSLQERMAYWTDRSEPEVKVPSLFDFMAASGRIVALENTPPLLSRVVIPVTQLDLPFLEGISLGDYGKITADHLDSAQTFKRWLQDQLLDLDTALDAVERDRALIRIGHDIADGVRSVSADLSTIRRKRAVSATGAVLGTVTATLAVVYGPAFQVAATIAGIAGAGSVWTAVQSWADNNALTLKTNRWYFVWSLTRHSERYDET